MSSAMFPISFEAPRPGFYAWLAGVLAAPILSFLLAYFYYVPNTIKDPRRRHLPPGPRGLPFIGNMLDLADSDQVRHKVRGWHARYGAIFHTKIGGSDYIWLSSPRTVKDLMDKRSSIYSSRAALPLAQDVASGGRRQLFLPYGPRWRQIRKHGHALLSATAATRYQPIQDYESKQLLAEMLDAPGEFYQINRRYAASVIMLSTYGKRVRSWDEPVMRRVFAVIDNLTEMTAPGAHAVDSFPGLAGWPEWLLGGWRRFGRRVFEHDSEVYLGLWRELKEEVDRGVARDCFCKEFYLNDPEKSGIDELSAAYTCGGLVEAGSETTASTLNNFILCMTLFPEAMRTAQEEIDRVVGSDRLPQWEDEQELPYTRALIKEVLRWRPVNKFGMTHASSEDDWYEGFFIPKGSVVVLNWW
ncbi:Cytochrome P450 [Lasiodiplodia theobromae]|nr:Cytochrome P450 [Lasiodiplodia theobromae]